MRQIFITLLALVPCLLIAITRTVVKDCSGRNTCIQTVLTDSYQGYTALGYPEWVEDNISSADFWLDEIENRTVCTISGHVNDNDLSQKIMYLNGQEYQDFTINTEGNYTIPYLYTRDAEIRLLFKKSGCLPSYRDISISYNNAMLQDYTVSNVNMYAFNLNDIRVSNAGNGSFVTIKAAIDFIIEHVNSGLYTGEAIRIRVLPGTYPESVDLSPLANLGITNFSLVGVGNAIINGDGYGIKLVVDAYSPCNGAVYNINSLKITGSGRGIIFKDYLGDETENVQAPHLTLHINNCTIYEFDSGSFSGTGDPIFSAAAIHFEGAGSITSCHIQDNDIYASSNTYSLYCQAGGVYICNNSSSITEVKNNVFTNNQGSLSGGLVAKGMGQILISDNEF
ncbi:MAG: hypothetical protein PHO32_05415, partial [Candidatus Cloacimonetes bacterium]|nr:hypothetical protein [Candidatus Cloacimonadota bacterium]